MVRVRCGGVGGGVRYSPRDPDAAPARRPASVGQRRDASTPLSLRAQPDLSFRPAPHLASRTFSPRLAPACPLHDQSVYLRGGRRLNITVLLLFHTRQSLTRAVGHKSLSSRSHCGIPLDTGVLIRIRREGGQDDGLACRLLWFPEGRRGLDV